MDARDDLARYELLASAIAGRPMSVARAPTAEEAYTDGRTAYLSAGDDVDRHRRELVVQCALVGSGSLAPDAVRRLVGRPAAARRYLVLETRRALDQLATVLPGLAATTAGDLLEGVPRSATVNESVARALGREPLPEPPPEWGTLRPRRVAAAADHDDGARPTARDVRHGAKAAPLRELDEDEETREAGPIARLFSSPLGTRGPLARLLHSLLGLGRTAGTGPAGAELPTGSARTTNRAGAHAVVSTVPLRLDVAGPPRPEPGVATYPEWDERRRRYRPDWCTVMEVDPRPEALRPLPRMRDDRLRRRLARLGVGLAPVRREPDGDDLDLDALVELEVDRRAARAGGAFWPVERVYVDRLRRRRDLAVLVLLDVSGSAAERGVGGDRIHEHQRATAGALLEALAALGDRVAAYGFSSRGRSAVQLVRVKTFDDPFDTRARERLGALEPGAFTRLGAAIRHGAHLLETHGGTPRRLLLVISDGFAYDHGYEGSYGEADARRALGEARRRGVGCLCLSVGAASDPVALRRVFGTAAYASAPRFDALSDSIGLLFARALRSAETRRQVAPRREQVRVRS